ncbi:tRNA pseudouridine(55) synthase TruB [Schaalia sp. ZJ1691]|uniref:tRNA pseudouridine synthase B n=1 Tax=Schaalia sp. ZJ1691 TaxID=2709404 RepID=UPI0013EA71F0|nr:tRNA pseudouridine(55) synthase TruB [Schaalia sp. ZJ1691]
MAKRPDHPFPGFLVIDKPAGITSHDVVSRIRRIAGTRKVGHGGTLDPMATGVVILGIGKATKLLTWVSGDSKSYDATIRLGISTSTDDAEGEVTASLGCSSLYAPAAPLEGNQRTLPRSADGTHASVSAGEAHVGAPDGDREREKSGVVLVNGLDGDTAELTAVIDAALERFRGEIEQVPSSVSAIKVNGKRAYARVRSGENVVLAARPVTIDRFDLTAPPRVLTVDGVDVIDLDVTVDCSSGTYIRALARDLGEALGVGGHLTMLRRTRIASITLDDAHTLDSLEARSQKARESQSAGEKTEGQHVGSGTWTGCAEALPMIPLGEAALMMFPELRITADEAERFAHGQAPADRGDAGDTGSGILAVVSPESQVLGLVERRRGKLRTLLVF